jgi:hypothetical protein
MALPSRKIKNLKELFEIFPGAKDIFIDGTETPIQRHKDEEKQKESYSGKKKAHTRKNIRITDINRWIGFLSPPEEGKKHDYGMFKGIFPPEIFPKCITLWLDLGFTGVDKDYPDASVMMPKKKPRGKELTGKESNKKETFNDKAMLISCRLWNYHLMCC